MPVQSAFIGWRQEPDSYLEQILGEERNAALNPIGTFDRNGIFISFGSDAPCTSPDPIMWIHKAVNHSNPSECNADSLPALRRYAAFSGNEDARSYAEILDALLGDLEKTYQVINEMQCCSRKSRHGGVGNE